MQTTTDDNESQPDQQTVDRKELRKQFLWLYGVIVALAIREATTQVVPLFTKAEGTFGWDPLFSLARFAILMLMIIRFYLGAVTVMNYELKLPSSSVSDAVDLVSGLIHFVLFFAWASTLANKTQRFYLSLSDFQIFLLMVLLYDMAWWLSSSGHRFPKLNVWTLVNLATALICFSLQALLAHVMNRPRTVECIVFVPVAIVSFIDILGTINQRDFFRDWFRTL